jgi:hypothetical protein
VRSGLFRLFRSAFTLLAQPACQLADDLYVAAISRFLNKPSANWEERIFEHSKFRPDFYQESSMDRTLDPVDLSSNNELLAAHAAMILKRVTRETK